MTGTTTQDDLLLLGSPDIAQKSGELGRGIGNYLPKSPFGGASI